MTIIKNSQATHLGFVICRAPQRIRDSGRVRNEFKNNLRSGKQQNTKAAHEVKPQRQQLSVTNDYE